jgi:hypothetical protein
MQDRVSFIESVEGIDNPKIITEFFDHFIALQHIANDHGKVSVIKSDKSSILFLVEFDSHEYLEQALASIDNSSINIYGRIIKVGINVLTDSIVQFNLR